MVRKIEASTDPVMQFLIQDMDDYFDLPTDGIGIGSVAINPNNGGVYMFTGQEWVLFGGGV